MISAERCRRDSRLSVRIWKDSGIGMKPKGGATLFMGPGVHLAFPGTTCGLTVGGGLILRATQSARFSDAPRDLPAGRRNGFVLRTELAFGLQAARRHSPACSDNEISQPAVHHMLVDVAKR